MQINLFAHIVYDLATAASKISILLLYLQIFPSKNFRLVVWAAILVAVAYGLASVFANLVGCQPIAKSWDSTIVGGSCTNKLVLYYTDCTIVILMDFATLLAPM